MKKLFYIFVFVSNILVAQPPTIISFTPTSGATGATVTIIGTNFNTTAANNIVWFGKVKATVTASTTTQLTVTVPVGTSAEPITVLNTQTSLLAQSAKPFIVTFTGGTINSSSISAKIDFSTGSEPSIISSGDLDGDGKLDLVVTKSGSNTISVFRNTASSSSISASSFSSKVDFATGDLPISISLGDLDGDGKLDMVVTNQGSKKFSAYRNISTSGNITASSFSAKVDFVTGISPRGISLGDLDGDGKLDIAVTNSNENTISVFRNTSTSGSLDTNSFAAKVDFTTGSFPRDILIADLNGDSKPDMATTNAVSNTISIYRNFSSSGGFTTSSFNPKVDFASGSNPFSISSGDLDNDGKLDLVVTSANSNTVSVYRNTSTTLSFNLSSFASKVDFATEHSPTGLSLGDLDGDGKLDLVVANSSSNSNSISVYRNTTISGSFTTSSFAEKLDFASGINPTSISLGDINGDGKLDIAVTNRGSTTFSVYRNVATSVLIDTEIPTKFSLSQNYPNPFNPSTTIRFGLPSESNVKVEIYNSLGQLVQVLVDESLGAYYYEVKWETGKIPSGLYFYKIIATDINNPNNKFVKTMKMVLMK